MSNPTAKGFALQAGSVAGCSLADVCSSYPFPLGQAAGNSFPSGGSTSLGDVVLSIAVPGAAGPNSAPSGVHLLE